MIAKALLKTVFPMVASVVWTLSMGHASSAFAHDGLTIMRVAGTPDDET